MFFLAIATEMVYVHDDFLVIFSFLLVVSALFKTLEVMLANYLDDYSRSINNQAKNLFKLQKQVLGRF